MNTFAVVILVALILDFAVNMVANLLNLRALKFELPPSLEGIYQAEDYRKSQKYVRTTTLFGLVRSTFTFLLLLVFWFSGGFNYLDQVVRAWGFVPVVSGLLYLGILALAYGLLTFPFGIYRTFVIEERFGFNRTNIRTFFLDRLKGLLLALILGVPVLAGILALFEYAGTYAWLYCWAAFVIFVAGMQYIAPTWLMPLFNKFKPMGAGELKEAILRYTRSVNFPIKSIVVMDGSRRSSKSNAFFTGFGRNKRIALFDTLIEKHNVPELVAILAHEIGHYRRRHIPQGIIISILHAGLLLFLLSLLLGSPGLYQAFNMTGQSVYAGLLFFGLLCTPVEMVLSIALQMISRKHEFEADRFAAQTITERDSLSGALKKLSTTNLSNLTPHPFYVFLNYTHPPLLQRLQAILAIKQNESEPLISK